MSRYSPLLSRLTSGSRIAQELYKHVTAVLGAFGLATLLGHLTHISWHGVVYSGVESWKHTVRPVTSAVLRVPLSLVGWHLKLPTALVDYVSAGAVLSMSYIRVMFTGVGLPRFRLAMKPHGLLRGLSVPGAAQAAAVIGAVYLGLTLTWPAFALITMGGLILVWQKPTPMSRWDQDRRRWYIKTRLFTLAPLPYLAAIVALNYLPLWLVISAAALAVPAALVTIGGKPSRQPTGRFEPERPPRQRTRRTSGGHGSELYVTAGTAAGARVSLTSMPVTIGRSDDSTVVIPDDYANRQHARVFRQEAQWFVEDLDTANGTYLNQTRITGPTPFPVGTVLRIGRTVIEHRQRRT